MFVIFGTDVLVLKDEDNPKCFTRTQYDFTCFFETSDNRTYDLFYMVSRYVSKYIYSVLCVQTAHLFVIEWSLFCILDFYSSLFFTPGVNKVYLIL